MAHYRLSKPAEAKIEESLATPAPLRRRWRGPVPGPHLPGDPGPCRELGDAAEARAGQYQGWPAVYPLRVSRRNVPRSIGMVGKPRGFIVGRIDAEGVLLVLTFVGEGMLDANVEREARTSEAEDKNASIR